MAFSLQDHKEMTQVLTLEDTSLGIMRWGRNNSFPQTLKNLIEQSPLAKPAVSRTAKFYKGAGFEGSEIIVNKAGLTLGELVEQLALNLATFGAFAIHCNYNLKGEPTSMRSFAIEDCRFNRFDELNSANMIGHYPNFALNSEVRKTVQNAVTRKKIEWFHRFNPQAALSQIEDQDGGISDYLGQVLYYSNSGTNSYPIPVLQAPINYVLSDIENSILMRKETSTGFINSYLLKTTLDDEDPNLQALETAIEESQGARGSHKIMVMSGLSPEDIQATVLEALVPGNGSEGVVNSITKSFELNQKVINGAYLIPPVLGGGDQKNGFGGTELDDAYYVFNAVTADGRRIIESHINRILKAGDFGIDEIKIKKLTLDKEDEPSDSKTEEAEAKSTTDPLAEMMRNMTGKQFLQLQRISRDYHRGKMSFKQASIQLKTGYGFTDDMVEEWLEEEEKDD